MNVQTSETTTKQSARLTRQMLSRVGRDSTNLKQQRLGARSMRRAMDEIKAGITRAVRDYYSDESSDELSDHFIEPENFESDRPLTEQFYRYFYEQEFAELMNDDDIKELQQKARDVHEAILGELKRLDIQDD